MTIGGVEEIHFITFIEKPRISSKIYEIKRIFSSVFCNKHLRDKTKKRNKNTEI